MIGYRWLTREAIEIMHQEQLEEHGGLQGLRDDSALEAVLARPINKAAYGEEDLFALAAAYLYGLVKNHPFSDGNKRTGFLAAFTFLYMNGHVIAAAQSEIIEFVLGVAAGEIDEEGATRFLRDFTVPI